MVITATDVAEGRVLPRALPGATVLQVAAPLRQGEGGHVALEVARGLVKAGARAIVAAEHGPLVDDLRAFGGEWLSLPAAGWSPARRRANTARLARFFQDERADIVHVHSAAAVRDVVASLGPDRVGLIANLPELPPLLMRLVALRLGALARCDRLIAPSVHAARPVIDRYRIEPRRVSVIPHSVDPAAFDPAAVQPARIAALRRAWGIPTGGRLVLVPGAVEPGHGQIGLVDVALLLRERGAPAASFVLVGDDRRHLGYVRRMNRRAQEAGVAAQFRFAGDCPDMPAAYAAADVVLAPYLAPPVHAHAVAQAQVMARPAIVTEAGALPEAVVAPPRAPEDVRTGWVVRPGDAPAMARALAEVLALDVTAYRALAARAHAFGRFMFTPGRAADATLDVYRSLLEDAD